MLYHTKNPHGGEVYSHPVEIDFSANINPLGTPEAVTEAVRQSIPLLGQYPDPHCRQLVEKIARYEGVDPDWVLCGNGAAELIYSLCAAVRPKRVLVPMPSFSEYRDALMANGAQIECFFLREEDDFALTEDFLTALENFRGEMVMLCSPNNPTGQIIPPELLKKILKISKKKGMFLFLDECFLDLTMEHSLSAKALLKKYRNLFILKAFTKSFAMPGLRLGYCLCANADLLKTMGRNTQAWNVSLPAQMAGIAALEEGDYLAQARTLIDEERRRMEAEMQALGLRYIPSRANFLLFHSSVPLYGALLNRGIQIRDCENYPGLGENWYRVAVKLPEQNRALLNAMEEILNG